MMVETILESSQDFGMSNGVLPQWKRELLQRRAARSRPAAPPPAPPPPPPPPAGDDDEELRYGPGIVKRLKSRYLSLALRDAPRRRPSVLRRAASLEHLLDERPPPAPRAHAARPPRPASVAAPPVPLAHAHAHALTAAAPPPRRDFVKRARSVDALTRLEPRDEPQPPPSPPPCAPRAPAPRAARPPRRPAPLLRDTERPPPDVVRSTLRKFEAAPSRRPAPAARVSAVLRGLEASQPRTSTPEPRARSPSPAAVDLSLIEDADVDTDAAGEFDETKPVSRAALDGIARAGSTVRYSFESPRPGSHLPPLAAASNPVLLGRVRPSASPRRVGVIRPMPAPTLERAASSPAPPPDRIEKIAEATPRIATPPPADGETGIPPRLEKKESPPSAFVEPIPRSPPDERTANETGRERSPPEDTPDRREPSPVSMEMKPDIAKIESVAKPELPKAESVARPEPLVNGHAGPDRPPQSKFGGAFSRIGAAEIERAWSGEKKVSVEPKEKKDVLCGAVWARGGVAAPGAGRKSRPPPPAATSVVFNFSNRKEVPDYIENDGIILRANRRDKIKAGDTGVVVLRPEALARSESDSDGEGDCGPPSPCGVRFINDNVLINGRSSMPTKPNKDRISKLKLQFDDSLTCTFEYPSETSLCEESPSAAGGASAGVGGECGAGVGAAGAGVGPGSVPAHLAPLAANTHIVSAALSRYTPSKTLADQFELGVTRHEPAAPHRHDAAASAGAGASDVESDTCTENTETGAAAGAGAEAEAEAGDARPCGADAARSWSEARTVTTDLLF